MFSYDAWYLLAINIARHAAYMHMVATCQVCQLRHTRGPKSKPDVTAKSVCHLYLDATNYSHSYGTISL